MTIKIEKGVPIPAQKGRAVTGVTQTLRNLEVWDSFLYPKAKRNSLGTLYKLVPGAEFVTRSIDAETIRVWRIK